MLRFLSLAAAAGALFLTGCSWFGSDNATQAPRGGFVVGDEPSAVQAGTLVLEEGGSAVDAATATYFALAATYPVAAGIGGGGVCLVHNQSSNRTEEFSFLARQAAGGGAYAVPGAVRGFALMQAVYGRLPWQRDVSPGEGFASAGFPISRALAERLQTGQDIIRLDASLSAEFLSEAGTVKPAGAVVVNPALGMTLSAIRRDGPNALYRGAVADKIIAYSNAQGGAIKESDLADYTPGRESPSSMNIGDDTAFVPSTDLGAGKFAQALLSRLVGTQGNTAGGDLTQAVATAAKSAADEFQLATFPRDIGTTDFTAMDITGQSVACAVTMYGPFGSGHTAGDTGVTLANAPATPLGVAAAFLTPVIATNSDGGLAFAGSGAGGPNGTAAVAYALVKTASGEDITKPGESISTGLAPYETVNLIACPGGVCATVADPGAYGLAAAAKQ